MVIFSREIWMFNKAKIIYLHCRLLYWRLRLGEMKIGILPRKKGAMAKLQNISISIVSLGGKAPRYLPFNFYALSRDSKKIQKEGIIDLSSKIY